VDRCCEPRDCAPGRGCFPTDATVNTLRQVPLIPEDRFRDHGVDALHAVDHLRHLEVDGD
jgi:hypothetical protein